MKLIDVLNEKIQAREGFCPRCQKPMAGILKAVGPFKGRGDFTRSSVTYRPERTQTREEAGLCTCQHDGGLE